MSIDQSNLEPERPCTCPEDLKLSLTGFLDPERAKVLGYLTIDYVKELGRYIDLTGLDGITIAYDYNETLANLDRGYDTAHRLTPSEGQTIGIAMTPSVIREGELKSHIVLNAYYHIALEIGEEEEVEEKDDSYDERRHLYRMAIHTLAHECAHVENTYLFNKAVPNRLLYRKFDSIYDAARWDVILACWDEYAATWRSAGFGADPTEGYEDNFLIFLADARERANTAIADFTNTCNVDAVFRAVLTAYGELMKYSAYHLGNMAGQGLMLDNLPRTKEALNGHWFAPYFNRLKEVCQDLANSYGKWQGQEPFEAIAEIFDDLVFDGGLIITDTGGGNISVTIR